ncbi:Alpha/Beta hydrolase protein [Dipodascopsis uninucleata]
MAFFRRPMNAILSVIVVFCIVLFVAVDHVYAVSASEYYVSSLPGAPTGVQLPKMHAGVQRDIEMYRNDFEDMMLILQKFKSIHTTNKITFLIHSHIEIKPEHHGNMFFWLVENEHIADKPRTVIWLNGGPGCSSMDGALMELGPFKVTEGGNLKLNEGRWNQFTNILFVDNPLGTGFSFVDTDSYLHELSEMSDDFMVFLDKFFDIFPQYLDDDLYIAGESFAGMYIPYIADSILTHNKNVTSRAEKLYPLKGIMIGNGWMDPVRQYLSYLPFAYQNGLIAAGSKEAQIIEKALNTCIADLNKDGPLIDVPSCEYILDLILELSQDTSKKDGKTCRNMYDIRLYDKFPACGANWPNDLEFVTPYLRDPEVVQALHIKPEKKSGWVECAGAVSKAFTAKKSRPTIEMIPSLLKQIQVLMFNGDQDIICNHLGNEDAISNMQFNGGTGFEESPGGVWAPRLPWYYDNEITGVYQSARNLTYVLVYNASHMVPTDLPLQSRDMMHRFIGLDYRYSGTIPPNSSVGNGTSPDDGAKDDNDSTHTAYYRAGEIALVIVAVAAVGFGIFVIIQRRYPKKGGYRTVGFGKDQTIQIEDGRISDGEDDDTDNVNELDELVVESPVVTNEDLERRVVFDNEALSETGDETHELTSHHEEQDLGDLDDDNIADSADARAESSRTRQLNGETYREV